MIMLTPNMQSTRGHGSGYCIPAGCVDAFRHSSFQLPSGYGITCLLMSSCLLPSRSSSSDWQVPWWCRGQIRSTLFLSAAHLARFHLFCLEFNSCSRHFVHLCHARHYSQEDMCIIGKEKEESGDRSNIQPSEGHIFDQSWPVNRSWLGAFVRWQNFDLSHSL